MSVDWGVVPIVPEIHTWLQEKGCNLPTNLESRYPTLAETLAVLESLDDLPVIKKNFSGNLWELTVGTFGSSRYAHILGSVEEDGLFDFHFWGSCQEETMVQILKRLASICGPLVIFEGMAATPMIVTQDVNVEEALEEWLKRIKQTYDRSDATLLRS